MIEIIVRKTGRAKIEQHNHLIKALRLKGYGSKRIKDELRNRGINIGRTTIHYRLKEIDKDLLREGFKIVTR